MWRQKCESGEGNIRSEEMDEMKRKFNAKIAELEAQLEAALAKAASLEKVKNRLQGEMDDLMVEVDKVRHQLQSYRRHTFSLHLSLLFLLLNVFVTHLTSQCIFTAEKQISWLGVKRQKMKVHSQTFLLGRYKSFGRYKTLIVE